MLATMATLGERLKSIRESKKISQGKLSRLTKINQSYLSQIETNKIRSINTDTARTLAEALGVSLNVLVGNETESRPSVSELLLEAKAGLEAMETVEVPLRGAIPAGYPSEPIETAGEMLLVPRELLRGASSRVYGLRVMGDSLNGDGIHSGEAVIVDPEAPIVDGKIYALRVENEVVARHMERVDGKVKLSSSNGAYKMIELDQVEVLGRIIGKGSWTKL